MSILFLQYPPCSTCQKAKKWLDSHGAAYEARHIKEQNPSVQELKEWHQKSGLPLKKFFNTSGLLYKNMNLKEKLPWGLVPYIQALLLSRALRGDLDGYPPFLWK